MSQVPPRDEIAVEPIRIELTAYYAVQRPRPTFECPPALLIALHGFGQKCKSFLRSFGPLRDRNLLIAAPQGPHQFYLQLEPKTVGFNWLTMYEKENSIRDFVEYMERLIGRLQDVERVEGGRVFVLGFSQGVSMAYRYAVLGHTPVGGLVACCADLPPDVADRLSDIAKFPVLIAHAEDDPVIPLTKADEAERVLRDAAFPIERLNYTGGHVLTPKLINAIGNWIEEHRR
jgi:predicted esterase